ncbi:MAG: dihydrolipoyl dehydrogenase [Gammaproteobacteria bacterium]
MSLREIRVPDIGDFEGVDVIEVLVAPGDVIGKDDSLITLESDKATMEIPAPVAGRVSELKVAVGDRVSQGTPILALETGAADAAQASAGEPASQAGPSGDEVVHGNAAQPPGPDAAPEQHTEVLVIGAGPGGYTAAFRAADLGRQVTLVERYPTLGGVCLNVGCIPSKALLHVAGVIGATETLGAHGVRFAPPDIELDELRGWKDGVVKRLTDGLGRLARQRRIQVIQGEARFESERVSVIETGSGVKRIAFEHAIIAAGSRPARLPALPRDDPRVMDSTAALQLEAIPGRLLIVGGGIIGLEMACVYDALGSKITLAEFTDTLMPGCDRDLVRPLMRRITARYENIFLETRVTGVESHNDGLEVHFEGAAAPPAGRFDRLLVAVGRRPNGKALNAEAAGVSFDAHGFIPVDAQQRSNVAHIYAIGDIAGEPLLAHKATHQGKVAAEAIAGQRAAFDARAVPAVAYTDPEVAWMGLTEAQADRQHIAVDTAIFPWSASGRALGMGREDGLTKLLFDRETGRLLGAGMVGLHAGDLIAETVLALELGADAADLALSIHPHPTLSETIAFAAEIASGTVTDLYAPRKRPTALSPGR